LERQIHEESLEGLIEAGKSNVSVLDAPGAGADSGLSTYTRSPQMKSPLKKAVRECLAQDPRASDKEILGWLQLNNPKVIPANWERDDSLPGKTFTKVRKKMFAEKAESVSTPTSRH
jgi:hypothetical protein